MTLLGFEFAAPAFGLGLLLGVNYGLLAVGLVLVYRNSKLVNFAHGDVGVGAAICLWVGVEAGIPFWLALPAVLVLGGALAAAIERSVIARLHGSPRAVAGLATLGAGQLVAYVASTLAGAIEGSRFPAPPGIPRIHIGTLIVHPAEVLALVVGPLAIACLVLFMTKTSWGLALRGTAANMDLARVSGFAATRLSALTWAISGVLATLTAVLLLGLESDSPPPTGLDLLLPALTAAVVASMRSLIVAAIAGVLVGVLQHLLLWNGVAGGSMSIAMFCVIFFGVLATRKSAVDVDKATRWSSIQRSMRVRIGRVFLPIAPIAVLLVGSLALSVVRPTDATTLTVVFGFIVLALSAAVMTGLSGELVLGQAAYAGLGAMASIAITFRTGDFFLGFAAAALAGGLAALVSSLPALGRRDLSLAVLSLGFSVLCVTWAFPQTWMFGSGIEPGRPIVGSWALTTAKSYGALALGILCIALALTHALWRSRLARRLVAQRDNPVAAATFGISASVARAQALLISGAIAGVAGALLAHGSVAVRPESFAIGAGITALGAAALGGLTAVSGGIWGTLFMVALPSFVGGTLGFIAESWVGWLLVIVAIPAGIVTALARAVPARTTDAEEVVAAPQPGLRERPLPRSLDAQIEVSRGRSMLDVARVSVTLGSLTILDEVSLEVSTGDIVGLVGRNGAGKSTLLDVISGQRVPRSGEVRFDRALVTDLGPEARARRGMVRSFEGAILFPTMTVLETTLLALESPGVGPVPPRRTRRDEAMAVVCWMGLERVAMKKLGELSTGVRRMAQLASLCARRPRLLVLDEPASGVAQAELDGLMSVLETVNRALGASMLIVEHDLRLVHGIASRVAILDGGRIVREGAPDDISVSI